MNKLVFLCCVLGVSIGVAACVAEPAPPQYAAAPPPDCPYGYYDYAPYSCAPYGYYGPEWFAGGVFVGAGPWYHGPHGFHGYVDNHYDPHYGYHGPSPHPGDHRDPNFRVDHMEGFHGNEMHEGHRH